MSIAAIIAASNAAYLIQKQNREEKQKEQELQRKKEISTSLLLQRKEYSMDLGKNEKIISIKIKYDPFYKNIYNKWISEFNDEILLTAKTFTECFQETLNQFNVNGYSIIPYSVSGYTINAYWLMLKIPDEEKIKKETHLKKMAIRLEEDLQTMW